MSEHNYELKRYSYVGDEWFVCSVCGLNKHVVDGEVNVYYTGKLFSSSLFSSSSNFIERPLYKEYIGEPSCGEILLNEVLG